MGNTLKNSMGNEKNPIGFRIYGRKTVSLEFSHRLVYGKKSMGPMNGGLPVYGYNFFFFIFFYFVLFVLTGRVCKRSSGQQVPTDVVTFCFFRFSITSWCRMAFIDSTLSSVKDKKPGPTILQTLQVEKKKTLFTLKLTGRMCSA